MAIGVAFGLMGAFFLAGMYVAAALGALSLIMMHFFSDAPLWNIMANKSWEGNTSFILVAVPLFILMGELMNRSGMGERMYAGSPAGSGGSQAADPHQHRLCAILQLVPAPAWHLCHHQPRLAAQLPGARILGGW